MIIKTQGGLKAHQVVRLIIYIQYFYFICHYTIGGNRVIYLKNYNLYVTNTCIYSLYKLQLIYVAFTLKIIGICNINSVPSPGALLTIICPLCFLIVL